MCLQYHKNIWKEIIQIATINYFLKFLSLFSLTCVLVLYYQNDSITIDCFTFFFQQSIHIWAIVSHQEWNSFIQQCISSVAYFMPSLSRVNATEAWKTLKHPDRLSLCEICQFLLVFLHSGSLCSDKELKVTCKILSRR